MEQREFDAIVIGAGPAGEVAAGRIGHGGLEVAIVERHLIGGECSYYACMPSKALLRPGELLAELARVPGAREAVSGELDVAATLTRRDEVIHDLDDSGQIGWLEEAGVTLVRGAAHVTGEREVAVGDERLRARRAVVIATGSTAALPPIDGLEKANPWTTREATIAKAVPKRLIVLGGGVAGCELAQAWASLGAQVTLLEGSAQLIAHEERFAGELLALALAGHGVDVRTDVEVAAVQREAEVTVTLADGATVAGDELLVATGRRPSSGELGLEDFGVTAGKPIEVDGRMRVPAHPWLYAVGDVNGRSPLTHVGKYQARIAADDVLGREPEPARDTLAPPPRVIFTDPAVAAVGHTLASARDAGIDARAVDHPLDAVAGASFHGRNAGGPCRLVIDESAGVLCGATFIGPEAAELLHAATIAVSARVPLSELVHAVPAFPTRSEVWLRLLEKAGL